MARSETALACFDAGFNCAQSVLSAFAQDFGLDHDTALRVAGAFGGGLARTGQTCGAVTGAMMAIGLRHAQVRPGDADAKQRCYALAQCFFARFRELHGSTVCRELLGYDLATPEGRQAAHDAGITRTFCPQLVRDAVELAGDLVDGVEG